MKERKILGLEKRDELIDNLICNYINNTAEKVTILVGTSGSGKSYVINNIVYKSRIKKLYTFVNCGNGLICPREKTLSLDFNSLSFSIGNAVLSLGTEIGFHNKMNSNIFNYAKELLKIAKGHNVLICIDDFTNVDHAIRSIYKVIINNIDKLEKELDEEIYFLISDSHNNFIYDFTEEKYIEKIILETYNIEDIIKYLEKKHLHFLINETIKNNLLCIEKICNGNLSLVDFLFVDIAIQNNNYFDALEKIIKFRIEKIKEYGEKQNISSAEMEDILLSSSLSLKRFSISEISKITQRENNTVTTGLNIALERALVNKDAECYYGFYCSEIKNVLFQESLLKRKEQLLAYYHYYTCYEQDEYYFRAYYLAVYYDKITPQSFALLALALIYRQQFMDSINLDKIYNLINSFNDYTLISDIDYIRNFYILLSDNNSTPDIIYFEYKNLKSKGYEIPLQAEITRACFYFMYRKCSPNDERINLLLENCIQFTQFPLYLSRFKNPLNLIQTDEAIIRLCIIYTIAPYILDVKNNINQFNDLYKLSLVISNNETSNCITGMAQYIENVFNRKAFLYVNQTQCDIFYEKAKSFFKKNQVWDELCITLICQAGTNIVIQQFEDAKECCIQAINIADDHCIEIPQISKLYNNYLIADFLETEKLGKSEKCCINKAKQVINKLKKQLSHTPCATEYVILTNLCSLSLYTNDESNYIKYKTELQKMMHCDDVSDIRNESIDDFYRYYFAWFEVFRMIQNKNWGQAMNICLSLKGFVPSLFKKQEVFWEKKWNALETLIMDKTILNAYNFCLNLVKTSNKENVLSKFFFRGLMVSDLQYTSFI